MEPHTAGVFSPFWPPSPIPQRGPTPSPEGHRRIGLLPIMCGAKSYAAIAPGGLDQDIALMHQLDFTRTPPISATSARF